MQQRKRNRIEQTVTRERSRLLGFIRRRVRIDEEAEDILQDVFYQFLVAYETIESLERVSAWLYQVARNKIIDSRRKRNTDSFSSLEETDGDQGSLSLVDILPDMQNMPDRHYLRLATLEALEIALEELPREQRDIDRSRILLARSPPPIAPGDDHYGPQMASRTQLATTVHLLRPFSTVSRGDR